MKRVLFFIIFISFSSILFSQETDEFSAFSFLGKMPIVSIQTLGKIDYHHFNQNEEKVINPILPYIVFDFLLNSQFNNESWNQQQVIQDFAKNKIDRDGNIIY